MGFLSQIIKILSRTIVDDIVLTPEEKTRKRRQEEADILGRELGTELTFIETLTQDEYDLLMKKEKEEELIQHLHEEGERIIGILKMHITQYSWKLITLKDMDYAFENANEAIFNLFLIKQNVEKKEILSHVELKKMAMKYYKLVNDIKTDFYRVKSE